MRSRRFRLNGGTFEGIPAFLPPSPYRPVEETLANDQELRDLLRTLRPSAGGSR
jgi:hypothetical protein